MTRSTATARPPAALVALVAALALACVASVAFGVRDVSAPDVLDAFLGHTDTASQSAAYVRIPRTVLAALVGAALAVAGTSMQAVTRNPLADPGIFGVLAGASLAVVVSLAVVGPLPTTATRSRPGPWSAGAGTEGAPAAAGGASSRLTGRSCPARGRRARGTAAAAADRRVAR